MCNIVRTIYFSVLPLKTCFVSFVALFVILDAKKKLENLITFPEYCKNRKFKMFKYFPKKFKNYSKICSIIIPC